MCVSVYNECNNVSAKIKQNSYVSEVCRLHVQDTCEDGRRRRSLFLRCRSAEFVTGAGRAGFCQCP